MKAAVCDRYGPPEVVQIKEVEKPAPNHNEVLVKVHAASLNPLDGATLKGRPYIARIMTGFRKPKMTRPGVDLAGEVEAIGNDVTQFKPGDEVFGVCISDPNASGARVWDHRQGSFAEYLCTSETTLAIKPKNVTFEQAASVPVAAFTALQGLRDQGHIQPGQKILVNGAAGGVGTVAVQIAKSFNVEVTGVCSTRNVDMVRSIGADYVIDYTQQDFTTLGKRYDLILDCVGNISLSACRHILTSSGYYIMVGDLMGRGIIPLLGRFVALLVLSRCVSQALVILLARPTKHDLAIMHNLMNDGKLVPVIDRRYRLSEVSEAIRYLEKKHAQGKVIITIEDATEFTTSARKSDKTDP